MGAAVSAARTVYGRRDGPREERRAETAADDAELARLRAELNAELERLASRGR